MCKYVMYILYITIIIIYTSLLTTVYRYHATRSTRQCKLQNFVNIMIILYRPALTKTKYKLHFTHNCKHILNMLSFFHYLLYLNITSDCVTVVYTHCEQCYYKETNNASIESIVNGQ